MKKEIASFWSLTARATLPITLLAAAVMTAGEILLFPWMTADVMQPELAFSGTPPIILFMAAMAAVYVWFCLRGLFGAKNALPVMRLGLSDRAVFLTMAAQNAFCLLILWAWQTGLAIALAVWWCRTHPALVGPQSVFVAFWRAPFLHGLLPLSDWPVWVRNILLCCALGVCAAKASLTRHIVGPLIVGLLAIFLFPTPMGSTTLVWIEIIVLVFALAIDFSSGRDFRRLAEVSV